LSTSLTKRTNSKRASSVQRVKSKTKRVARKKR
jgi:hypothetical protein